MPQGFFDYDNPVWRFIGKLGDLILLNILWIICSIPVFTVGASTTAVYYVTLKLVRDEDNGVLKAFFHSFLSNFKQATAIWLIMLAAGALLTFDFWVFASGRIPLGGVLKFIVTGVFGGFLLIWFLVLLYVFPLQSRFYNPVKKTVFNAFFIAVSHLAHTAGMVCADIAIGAFFFLSLYFIPQAAILLILFGLPLIAFVNSFFFTAVFKKYLPKEERDHGTEIRPLFENEDPEIEKAFERLK